MEIRDFGVEKYGEVLSMQESLFQALVDRKKNGIDGDEFILIGEHFPVITLGRRAKESNILLSEKEIDQKGIEIFHIGRGGDVTFHCPGQLILYPIIDLEYHKLGVKDYVWVLEESIIKLLQKYDIQGERIDGATGVWIDKGFINERKISAIGIKCNRYCTMHGLSLNVENSLDGFLLINPCGFVDKGITTMKNELSATKKSKLNLETIKQELLEIFIKEIS